MAVLRIDPKWRPRIAAFLVAVSATGCAGSGLAVTGRNSEDPTWNDNQAETAAASARSGDKDIIVVTYNDGTNDPFVKYTKDDRVVYPGASNLGWSYSFDTGKTWTYGGKVKPPPGIDALWGDPAIVASNTSYNRVYISSLAIAAGKLPAGGHHGYLSDGTLTGACVARSDDGGVHFKIHGCVTDGGNFYDGGAMAAGTGNDSRIFAAFVNVNKQRIDVWASPDGIAPFTKLADPFPGLSMFSHPRLAYDRVTGALVVAAIAGDSFIRMNRLVGNTWQNPVVVSKQAGQASIDVHGENLRTAYGFSFDVGTPSQTTRGDSDQLGVNDDGIRLLYTTRDAETHRYYVRGSACSSDLARCRDVPEWGTTPGNLNTPGNQWNPTVKAWVGFFGLPPIWKATYQSTDDTKDGIGIKQGNLAVLSNGKPNGLPIFLPFNLVPPRTPCPDYRDGSPGHAKSGYWGDYDEMAMVGFDKDSNAQFLLAFTDSGKGCNEQHKFTSKHVHVSAKVFS